MNEPRELNDSVRYSDDDIIDAGRALGWTDHDIALLVSTLQELAEESAEVGRP